MKTAKILSVISLMVIFAGTALLANRLMINDPGAVTIQKPITYEVKVNFAPNFPGTFGHFLIAITDGAGQLVLPSQPVHKGVWSYKFQENGTFRGTRAAVIIPFTVDPSGWVIPPCVLKGMFYGGASYRFNLTPQAVELIGPGKE